MKKTIVIILLFVLAVNFSACGSNSRNEAEIQRLQNEIARLEQQPRFSDNDIQRSPSDNSNLQTPDESNNLQFPTDNNNQQPILDNDNVQTFEDSNNCSDNSGGTH